MNPFTKALNEALGREPDSLPHDNKSKPTSKRRRKKLKSSEVFPEPGEWVYEIPKGMEPVAKPEPISADPISASEVKHHVRHEGLGFCVYSLIPASRIEDERLDKLWRKARRAMQDIVEYLEETE